jgi:hypothetical protein
MWRAERHAGVLADALPVFSADQETPGDQEENDR